MLVLGSQFSDKGVGFCVVVVVGEDYVGVVLGQFLYYVFVKVVVVVGNDGDGGMGLCYVCFLVGFEMGVEYCESMVLGDK